jgi:hypothetical protein
MKTLKNQYKVKQLLFLLVAVFIAGKTFSVQAQDSDITVRIAVIHASSSQSEDGVIQIEVESVGSKFIYMLYDKEPWKGGNRLQPDTKSGESFSFTGLRRGRYCVCVQNKNEAIKCTDVLIEPKQ